MYLAFTSTALNWKISLSNIKANHILSHSKAFPLLTTSSVNLPFPPFHFSVPLSVPSLPLRIFFHLTSSRRLKKKIAFYNFTIFTYILRRYLIHFHSFTHSSMLSFKRFSLAQPSLPSFKYALNFTFVCSFGDLRLTFLSLIKK